MARNYQINDAARSLDQQQFLDWLRGWQVVDPGGGSNAVSAGTGSFEYDAAAGDINAGGSIVTCSQETVDFAADIDASDDKMAVIYRDASGTLQKSVGSAGTRDPSGSDPRNTHTPPPPTLHNTNGVVLAEVLLPAGASSIGSDEFRDRRDPEFEGLFSRLDLNGLFTTHAEKVSEATTTSGQRRIFADTSVSGFPLTLSDADTVLGNEIALRVIGDGDLTIETESAQTVDGGSSITITATDGEVTVSSDGDDWFSDRFGDFSAITTGSVKNQIGDASIQSAFDGLVVPVAAGLGIGDAVDPSETTTPVQDAIDAVDTPPGGAILLPPESVTNQGEITLPQYVSIFGWGPLSSEIVQPDTSEDGIVISSSGGGTRYARVQGFTLDGDSLDSNVRNAIRYGGTAAQMEFSNLLILDWHGRAVYGPGSTAPYENSYRQLRLVNIDAGNVGSVIQFDGGGRASLWENIGVYPTDSQSGAFSTLVQPGGNHYGLQFRYLNVGGSTTIVLDEQDGNPSMFSLYGLNYEPNSAPGTAIPGIFKLAGNFITTLQNLLTTSGGNYDYVFDLGVSNAKIKFEPMALAGDANQGMVNISEDPFAPSYYFGPASDITVSHGGSTEGEVRSLATAGAGNG